MNRLLFVYGTLLDAQNEYALYLKSHSNLFSRGKIKGKLYDIGQYPGAILSYQENEYIYGTILEINDGKNVLPVIDDYEGFGHDQPQPNEFIRVITEVETAVGLLNSWIYLYNLSVEELPQIKSGRYHQ